MANTKQATKRVRQNERHAERNRPLRTRAARTLREARTAIAAGDPGAGEQVRAAHSALDRAAKHNIMHPNSASRRKSRLAAQLKAAGIPA